jgi:hypothetical protein
MGNLHLGELLVVVGDLNRYRTWVENLMGCHFELAIVSFDGRILIGT